MITRPPIRLHADLVLAATGVRSTDTSPCSGGSACINRDARQIRRETPSAIQVGHFQRRPSSRTFSVERFFGTLRDALPPTIECRVAVSRYESVGLFRRIYNVLEAATRQGDVNHVTGDVHYLCYLLNKRRTVLTVLDCRTMERLRGVKRLLFRLLWLNIPVRRCACVVAISEFSKRELLRYVNVRPEKIRVIGVSYAAEYKPVPGDFHKDKPTILQLGTGPNKNLFRVAAALTGLSCRMIILGPLTDAQRRALIEGRIDYENNPRATDAEVIACYSRCDLVLFVSTYEGFGMPIIEANAIGRPVVTSCICSMPEVAGDAACLVDPYDPEAIRQGVLRVIEDDAFRENLVQNGFRNAARFAPEEIARRHAEIYVELSRSFKRR